MSKQNPIADKISALLSKTVENGASESESVAALEAANRLMAKHGITLDDIKSKRVGYDFVYRPCSNRKKAHPVDFYLSGEIAAFTDTESLVVNMGAHNNLYLFIGYSIDVDYATFVRTVIFEAMESGWAQYKASLTKGDHASKYRASYMRGMANRLCRKMRQLKEETVKSTGTDLVVCKQQLVKSKIKEMFPESVTTEVSSSSKTDRGAFAAGYDAGDKVGLRREFKDKDDQVLAISRISS